MTTPLTQGRFGASDSELTHTPNCSSRKTLMRWKGELTLLQIGPNLA
jgi:hypothetical protein